MHWWGGCSFPSACEPANIRAVGVWSIQGHRQRRCAAIGGNVSCVVTSLGNKATYASDEGTLRRIERVARVAQRKLLTLTVSHLAEGGIKDGRRSSSKVLAIHHRRHLSSLATHYTQTSCDCWPAKAI